MHIALLGLCITISNLTFATAAFTAEDSGDAEKPTTFPKHFTPSLMGPLGLNTTASARFAPPGTVSFTGSTADPYSHLVLGSQLTENLFVALRQTGEISGLTDLSDRLFPGMDLKLKLLDENAYTPALAVGLQSAFGHKRMAGEYLVASKRFGDFDFSGGMAWGRLGSAAHISNPLEKISGHFGRRRALDGENPNDPGDWFTGPDVGFFAGVEYAPPDSDFSIKADWGADRHVRELTVIEGFNTPDPWSVSIDYHPRKWISANIGVIGGEKLMGRLTLRNLVQSWPERKTKQDIREPVYPYRSGNYNPSGLVLAAEKDNLTLSAPQRQGEVIRTALDLRKGRSAPLQIGRTLRQASLKTGKDIEAISIIPVSQGLRGRALTLRRSDFENALAKNHGSPQEIWHNTNISKTDHYHLPFAPFFKHGNFILQQDLSLAEEDQGAIGRTSLLYESESSLTKSLFLGFRTRLNLVNNLERLNAFAALNSENPVRSDINRFANQTTGFDRLYASYMATPYSDLHIGFATGYLEEVYGGFAGEVLYRPFGKTYAAGIEIADVVRRDPNAPLNFGFENETTTTGHLNLYYELPGSPVTLEMKAGRYLAGDWGGTLGATRHFRNGARLRAFITATNEKDMDIFGGESNLYGGLQFALPLDNIPHIPEGTEFRTDFSPIGRDKGQVLNSPLDLYKRSEKLSYRHMTQNWPDIME